MNTLKRIARPVYKFLLSVYHQTIKRVLLLLLDLIAALVSVLISGNDAYPVFEKHGYHLLRKHYYLPIPDQDDLSFIQPTELVGVDMNEAAAFDLLDNVLAQYKPEFNAFPTHEPDEPTRFHLINGSFMAIDGNVYYSLIRHHRPAKIIEIGSGNSTLLAVAALRQNKQDGASATELICIEPHPDRKLRQDIPELTRLIEDKVQNVERALFESLQAGDILFIDSTHVLRPGGDVWWEYCEILPRLAPGVLVHVHDVSLPKPYPRVYFDYHWYWTEQYLLQAFLAFNSRFEVIWPGNYLMTRYPERMQRAFSPEYDLMREAFPFSEPSSLWMRVKDD